MGSYQLLNENQLHYLVEIVGAKLGDTELFPTLPQKAAVYAHHIITGHLFSDGNKRVGLTCALAFLVLNGCSLHRDIEDSIIELGFNIADGTITDLKINRRSYTAMDSISITAQPGFVEAVITICGDYDSDIPKGLCGNSHRAY